MEFADPDGLDQDALARVGREIHRFERLAEGRRDLALRPYWSEREPHASLSPLERLVCLSGLIKADLRRRFELGEPVAVSAYLDQFPQLRAADSRVVSLVYEEFCLREERGEVLDVDSFCDRYPDWKDSLVSQLGYHRILSLAAGLAPPKPNFPDVGDEFEEFSLLAQIGKGGYSRVFLAADRSLGGKRVVLKVSIDRGQEAETQGALDHPHIVPVNAVVYQPAQKLRGLSMPYRPGLPLDEVIQRVRRPGAHPPSARSLWEALVEGVREGSATAPLDDDLAAALKAGPVSDGWRGFPLQGSFAQGVAWIGLVIARALAYAHDRKTYHRDVKPGNVLLTIQHGPQLLDFNLAQSPHAPSEAGSAFQGGTLPYMAPEQIEAFLNPDRWDDVAAAADIYSLGLVLRELLTGQALDMPDSKLPPPRALCELLDRRLCLSADVRLYNREVPYALEAIVQKCLRHDPAERYASGADLAEDLERLLQHRPMAYAENPSKTERARNWATRHRRLVAVNVFYLTVLALISPMLIERIGLLLLPPLKEREEYRLGVAAVDDGRYAAAIGLFTKLEKDYPDSPLPSAYLSIAHVGINTQPEDDAQRHYLAAMHKPGADGELREWARSHPRFLKQLAMLGTNRLDRAKAPLTENARDETVRDDKAAMFDRIYQVANHALTYVLESDDSSIAALHGLATTAEHRKEFELARDFLCRLIQRAENGEIEVRGPLLVSWRIQRARVVTGLGRQVAEPGPVRPADPHRAMDLVNDALKDLEICSRRSISKFQLPHYYSVKAEVLLTRGELHCQAGSIQLAQADCRDAKAPMEMWFDLTRAAGEFVPEDFESKYRTRFRKLQERIGVSQAASDADGD
ncbi:serine/threonine-protein kinase [Paludisphaera soli]|uniref:serine/threonine-protein kinase n=1 Tax=Paludisphaera soli TaxID=2712865 RepID=UPI0013EA80C7|nr:serine/threonine-protein kinase [Paludisphaera soli]